MTMLAMWLGTMSVALAADSRSINRDGTYETNSEGIPKWVPKLHRIGVESNKRVQPDKLKVMFGVEFGKEEVLKWLVNCPCGKHAYPQHWRDCFQAESVDALEQVIRRDLIDGGFPTMHQSDLGLWVAGINEQELLEAFILNGAGERIKDLSVNTVEFNETSKQRWPPVLSRIGVMRFLGLRPSQTEQLSEIEQQFWSLKGKLDAEQTEFSGAVALERICEQVVNYYEQGVKRWIGGQLEYQEIRVKQA